MTKAIMPSVREFVLGPWRAVSVLGVTEILSWGALFYPPVLTVPLIAADHGWSKSFTMGGFSVGLLVGGLVSRHVGALIDRFGGHVVMPCGSLIGAAGLLGLVQAPNAPVYYAAWTVVGVAMAAALYDPAFATLGRIFGRDARAPITMLTLAGGFASTVSWPVTQVLIDRIGWRGAYLVYAALLALVAAPLHALALPRQRATHIVREAERAPKGVAQTKPAAVLPAYGVAYLLVAAAFSAYAFVPSALSAQLLAIFERFGLTTAAAVAIGMLFGPAQVLARICELAFGANLHPLWTARLSIGLLVAAFVLLALLPFSGALAAVFAVLYGMANGLMTIARGTVPLALFGAAGYGRLIGRIAGPYLVVQAAAPVCLSFVAERTSDGVGLAVVAAFAVVALLCFAAIRVEGANSE
jgi:MFS family permease